MIRARIVLHSADRLTVADVAWRAGVGRPAVWLWQRRFVEAAVDGLLHDATRKPGEPPLGAPTVNSSGRTDLRGAAPRSDPLDRPLDGQGSRISPRSVQRIWADHELQPFRLRIFKRFTDPEFVAKLEDIVGLCVDPPKHAIVLSVDEKYGPR